MSTLCLDMHFAALIVDCCIPHEMGCTLAACVSMAARAPLAGPGHHSFLPVPPFRQCPVHCPSTGQSTSTNAAPAALSIEAYVTHVAAVQLNAAKVTNIGPGNLAVVGQVSTESCAARSKCDIPTYRRPWQSCICYMQLLQHASAKHGEHGST